MTEEEFPPPTQHQIHDYIERHVEQAYPDSDRDRMEFSEGCLIPPGIYVRDRERVWRFSTDAVIEKHIAVHKLHPSTARVEIPDGELIPEGTYAKSDDGTWTAE